MEKYVHWIALVVAVVALGVGVYAIMSRPTPTTGS